ncbi:MAG TPA: DUF6106 family protein [Ruminococcus flavefaciens]|nr:DUF6106 family protein [Ruminococcus flavefaciens]
MDNFAEQLVKKQYSSSDKIKKVAVAVIGIILTAVFAVGSLMTNGLAMLIGLLIAIAAAVGTFMLIQNMYVEYEYTFTNGELDIDKIIAKKKRKEMLTVDIRKFTDFGKYDEAGDESSDMTVIFASDNIASGEYFADFTHEEYGNTRLVFSPDEKMLDNIKRALPGTLRRKPSDN